MISVQLVTNSGDGRGRWFDVVEGCSLSTFLETHFDGCPDDFDMTCRHNGNPNSFSVDEDYCLQHEDRITLSPTKVEGAA